MKIETQIRPDMDGDDTNFTNLHEFQILSLNSWQFVQFVSLGSSSPHTGMVGERYQFHESARILNSMILSDDPSIWRPLF